MKDLLQGIHTKLSGRSGRGTEGSKSSLTNSAPRSIPVTREVAQLARQGWGTKTPLTTQARTEVRKYKLLDQEIVMPIMRGKIQAILTTDAALLYGLGGHSGNRRGRVEIRREMDNTAARQAFNQTRDESCS